VAEAQALVARAEPGYEILLQSAVHRTRYECGEADAVITALRADTERTRNLLKWDMADGTLAEALVHAGRPREAIDVLRKSRNGLDMLVSQSLAGLLVEKGYVKELEEWWASAAEPEVKSAISVGAVFAYFQKRQQVQPTTRSSAP
jgi:hypothetical protein